ncbi:unnamed protein product, partial [Chrysoparadoxa australica]
MGSRAQPARLPAHDLQPVTLPHPRWQGCRSQGRRELPSSCYPLPPALLWPRLLQQSNPPGTVVRPSTAMRQVQQPLPLRAGRIQAGTNPRTCYR